MPRGKIALLVGIVGFVAYIAVVVALGDFFVPRHWTLQAIYYAAAGFAWVYPAILLIRWGARPPS